MAQVFRIEIPVNVTDNSDKAALQQLESSLKKIFASMNSNKATVNQLFDAIEQGANEARAALQEAGTVADSTANSYQNVAESASNAGSEQTTATEGAASAAEQLDNTVSGLSDTYTEAGNSATEAGRKSGSAFEQAASSADKFTQRMEKSNNTLRNMFKEKLKLTLAAIDRASPVLKSIWNSAKSLTQKAWRITVRMADFATAPFRKLLHMISSPITMALSIAGIGFGAGSIISTFSDFESGMSTVKALTGATDAEFAQLTSTAQNLGATTKFTATEASEGMKYLAMAGWETNQIIDAMPGLLNLAAAGATDLGTAADIVSDVMTAMGMAAGEAGTAADIFAKTATSTNTTIEGLGATMKYAAPIAHSFGMSLADVAAAAGLMANAGIKDTQAGTALRASLLRMASPTTEMAKTMTKLGLSFTTTGGKMKSMSTIVSDLETAFAGLSEAEKLASAQEIFGTEAASAWLGLVSQGSEAYNQLLNSLEHSTGAAEQMAKTQLDNLKGDITLLQSAADGMWITLVGKLNPYMRQGVQWLTGKIPAITDALSGLIEKAVGLKDHLDGVFSSREWQNADGFMEKAFVAWDKIVAEPFDEWWNGNGRAMINSAAEKIGGGLGDLYHGIIAGIFAAIKGEEIDFGDMNITGLARAGAEAAQSFVSAFMAELDLAGLVGDMPGLMKAGLLGFGALKLGQGGYGAYKTVSALKYALTGVNTSAQVAGPAIAAVGTKAATSAVGIGKATSILGGLKVALSAVPVWGWIAAAAVTTAAIGIKTYTDAQERQRQSILSFSDDVAQASEQYQQSANNVREAAKIFDDIRAVELVVVEGKNNTEVITKTQASLAEIHSREAYILAQLASGSLTPEEIAAYQSELDSLHGKEVELKAKLAEDTATSTEIQAYVKELSALQSREEFIKMELERGVTGEQAAAYMQELEIIKGREEEITLSLKGLGVTTAGIIYAKSLISSIEDKTAEINVILGESSLSKEERQQIVDDLSGIYSRQAEIDLTLSGASLTEEQVKAYKDDLEGIQSRTAEIEAKIAEGGLSQTDLERLSGEYAKLKTKEAQLTLMLSGQGLTQEQLGALVEEYDGLENKKAEITAKLSESGLTEDQILKISEALGAIGDKQAQLTVSFSKGSLTTQDLQDAAAAVETMYNRLAEMSGGAFTAEDLKSGAISEAQAKEVIQTQADIDLLTLQRTVEDARAKKDAAVSARSGYQSKIDEQAAIESDARGKVLSINQLEIERQRLNAAQAIWEGRYDRKEISADDYYDYYEGTFAPAMRGLQDRYKEITGLPMGPGFDYLTGENGSFDSSFWTAQEESAREERARYQRDYDTQNQSLIQLYSGEKQLMEGQIFNGSELAGMSLEEVAASYTALDEAGRKMFDDAVKALNTLNEQTNYIAESDKTQAVDVIDLAEKTVVMQDIKTQVQSIATDYQALTAEQQATFAASAEGAAQLEAVNAALEALGLDQIESLDQLNSALDTLSNVDLSSFSLETVQSAFKTLGGEASGCKSQIDNLRSAITSLDGLTATTHVYNYTHNITTYSTSGGTGGIGRNANGGIYDGAFLSWVAEDGPEAIIPLGADKRNRGLDLWLQAGEALGVAEFADGGIVAPYSKALENLPDDLFTDDGDDDNPEPKPRFPVGKTGGGGTGGTFHVSVSANPTYHIEGSDSNIIEKLKGHQRELAEIVAQEISSQLEDIITNM